jgi:hypothetical protein
MTRRAALLLFPLTLLAGCFSQGPTLPTAVEAKGKVLLPDGRPLTGGRVTLNPQAATEVEAFGDVNPDGTFTLTTYKPGDGAVPGTYVVTVSPFNYRSKTGSPTKIAGAAQIPARYGSAGTSDLKVTISPDGGNNLALKLSGR